MKVIVKWHKQSWDVQKSPTEMMKTTFAHISHEIHITSVTEVDNFGSPIQPEVGHDYFGMASQMSYDPWGSNTRSQLNSGPFNSRNEAKGLHHGSHPWETQKEVTLEVSFELVGMGIESYETIEVAKKEIEKAISLRGYLTFDKFVGIPYYPMPNQRKNPWEAQSQHNPSFFESALDTEFPSTVFGNSFNPSMRDPLPMHTSDNHQTAGRGIGASYDAASSFHDSASSFYAAAGYSYEPRIFGTFHQPPKPLQQQKPTPKNESSSANEGASTFGGMKRGFLG